MNKTPITERLDELHDQWVSFAEAEDARILVWQARGDEEPLLEAFVARENDDASAATPDTFLKLVTSFTDPVAHGLMLREELIGYYDQIRDELQGDGLDGAWDCPPARVDDGDTGALLAALASLRQHHADPDSILSVWLDPKDVSSDQGYLLWLQRLARSAPTSVRFIVIDSSPAVLYEPLVKVEPARVIATRCDLDMPSALTELAQQASEDAPSPGTEFRLLLTKLGAASAQGSLAAALPLATTAIALATAQGWLHLAALVHIMLGSVCSAHGEPLEAAKAYTEADRLAEESEKAAADQSVESTAIQVQSRQLRLNARLGQGATMIACEAWGTAADVYLATAPLAAALDDVRSELDCLRMASVCYAQHGDSDKAWNAGTRGLQVAQAMNGETRALSSLPYLGDHLLRMAEAHSAYAAYRVGLDKQLTAWLGEDWRPKHGAGAAA